MWHVAQHHQVTIRGVESASDSSCVLRFDAGNYPDLASARELHPELARLWDAVRHEFWRNLLR